MTSYIPYTYGCHADMYLNVTSVCCGVLSAAIQARRTSSPLNGLVHLEAAYHNHRKKSDSNCNSSCMTRAIRSQAEEHDHMGVRWVASLAHDPDLHRMCCPALPSKPNSPPWGVRPPCNIQKKTHQQTNGGQTKLIGCSAQPMQVPSCSSHPRLNRHQATTLGNKGKLCQSQPGVCWLVQAAGMTKGLTRQTTAATTAACKPEPSPALPAQLPSTPASLKDSTPTPPWSCQARRCPRLFGQQPQHTLNKHVPQPAKLMAHNAERKRDTHTHRAHTRNAQ